MDDDMDDDYDDDGDNMIEYDDDDEYTSVKCFFNSKAMLSLLSNASSKSH
jgi:hypothetical protein